MRARPAGVAWLRRTLSTALAAAIPAGGAAAQSPLFLSDSVVELTLRTDLRSLLRDRDTTGAPWRGGTLTWGGPDGPVTVPLQVRTRGNYRLRHCDFPPLRLRLRQEDARGTLVEGLRRPKLVTHCRDWAEYRQNLLQEYALYRVFRLVTPIGVAARLVRVTYEDSAHAVRSQTHFAIVTEDPERLAERLGGTLFEERDVRLRQLEPAHTDLLGLFQYFAANTDWSVPFSHNVELVRRADTLWAVPFDFDWAGVIGARYAQPAPQLPIRSVRERIFRGVCRSLDELEPALARFETLRDSIAAVYRSVPGLEPRVVDRTLRFYDEFYRAIADRQRFWRRVVEPDCFP